MAGALALPLVASLAALASADVHLDLRAEARTSTLAAEGFAPETRQALLARPGAALRLDATPVRLDASYGARIWTSDVAAQPDPFVTQEARLRVETHHPRPWRAGATIGGVEGRTDPLADPVQSLPRSDLSQTTLAPVRYEALSAGVDAAVPLGHLTTISWDATAMRSGGIGVIGRASMPLQGNVAANLAVSHLLSVRTALRVDARATATRTEAATATTDSGWVTATAELRRQLTPTLEGWAGAGAAASVDEAPGAPASRDVVPIGQAGLAHRRGVAHAELSVSATPFTDRFTGDVGIMAMASGAVGWRATPRLSFESTGSAGALPSGDTALAALDARGRYALRERLAVEAGIVGRWQRERRAAAAIFAPSFAEIGVVVALAWDSGPPRP